MFVSLIYLQFFFHPTELANARYLRSDLVLLYSLSFGPVVPQASRMFTRTLLVSFQFCMQVFAIFVSDTTHQALITHFSKYSYPLATVCIHPSTSLYVPRHVLWKLGRTS